MLFIIIMSKRTIANRINKNTNNNIKNKNSLNNKQYNLIINQNSTFNQDNRINIMLDSGFPYFQNYNYQPNETDPSNQIYPLYPDYQSLKTRNNQNDSNKKNNEKNEDNKNIINCESNKKKSEKKLKKNYSPSKKDRNNKLTISQGSTNKIDYRYNKRCPINEMISSFKSEDNDINTKDKENQLFWFATYDKLMKTKHLIKIFNYYNNKIFGPINTINNNNKNLYSEIKEKTLIIKDFEICFYENSNKPFIRYSKGGIIYTKLYLLTLKEISQIFSYINRIEYKIDYDRLNYLQKKGNFELIKDNSNGIILPYCLIYSLGKYMNINIYSFSNNVDYNLFLNEINMEKNQRISSYTIHNSYNNNYSNDNMYNNNNNNNIKKINYKLPNSKKIVKLIKIINLNFPDFSIEDIINYLIPDNKYINSITKIIEIKNLFFFKKSIQNKIILNSMVRDTIKGISIQTPKSLISSFCPAESILDNNSFKNSDLFQPFNKKYNLPIKDDYKFQTISTTEKDNNKKNPLVIYVCDNGQKVSFSENQNQNIFQNQNQYNNYIKRYDTNSNEFNDVNDTGIEKNSYIIKTGNNQDKINNTNNIQNNNNQLNDINNNYNQINNNKSQNIPKEKLNCKKKSIDVKINQKKILNNMNNASSGKKKIMKLQRISTDVLGKIKNSKMNSLTGSKIRKKSIKEINAISHTNININNDNNNNNNNNKGQISKSIESHFNYTEKCRLSKTSDISQGTKKNSKNFRNTLLIKRINMDKKNNPFFNKKK